MNQLKTTILLAFLTALFMAVGYSIANKEGMFFALLLALIFNFLCYWFSDQFILRLYKAVLLKEQSSSKLFKMVKELSLKNQIPMPRLYLIYSDSLNAFATGRDPKHAAVAVTEGLLRKLNDHELFGVLAHELSHIKNRDTLTMTVTATLAGAISYLAQSAQLALRLGYRTHQANNRNSRSGPSIFSVLFAPLLASLIQLAVSRSREFAADESGAKLCGNPLWLVEALLTLEKENKQIPFVTVERNPATAHLFIVNPLTSGQGFLTLFATHPPIAERVKRLKQLSI